MVKTVKPAHLIAGAPAAWSVMTRASVLLQSVCVVTGNVMQRAMKTLRIAPRIVDVSRIVQERTVVMTAAVVFAAVVVRTGTVCRASAYPRHSVAMGNATQVRIAVPVRVTVPVVLARSVITGSAVSQRPARSCILTVVPLMTNAEAPWIAVPVPPGKPVFQGPVHALITTTSDVITVMCGGTIPVGINRMWLRSVRTGARMPIA